MTIVPGVEKRIVRIKPIPAMLPCLRRDGAKALSAGVDTGPARKMRPRTANPEHDPIQFDRIVL
jgi:hypothetical protein